MDIIRQFNNQYGAYKNLIQKALTSASGSGGALIPQHLEEVITNAIPRLSPALAMVSSEYDPQKLHEFNRLTALPSVGGAMGESATTPTTQPTFVRDNVTLKVIRRKGATTDFLQSSSKKDYDAAAENIEASLLQHAYDLENYMLYGNASSNTYEFSGIDTFVTTNRSNEAVGGAIPTTLTFLDNMLDENLDRQGSNHNKAFVMSPQMLSKVSSLLTNVRLNQGLVGGLSQVDVPGGWRLNAYRDVPIIVSSACRPKTTMGTVTPGTATTGGTIPSSTTYYFRVSAVTINGEQVACAEINQATGAGTETNTVTLTFTPVSGAYRYKVYAGSATGELTLSRVVPAFTYDVNGTITSSDTDVINAGETSVTSNASGNVNVITLLNAPTTAGSEVPTGLQSDVPFTADLAGGDAPEEYIFLWDLDRSQGLGKLPYTNQGGSRFNGLVTIEDLSKTDDFLPFLIKSYCALCPSFEATSVIHRGLRVS